MKGRLYRLWARGQLYIVASLALASVFALNERIGIWDWQKEVAYFQYIRDSLTTYHSIPWFWWRKLASVAWYPAVARTSAFVSIPETMLFSPFTPLLLVFDVLTYVKLLAVVHPMIGIAGCFALRRLFKWDNGQFRVFLALFLFSPIVIQHLAIGYTPWLNLWFFPWLIYFVANDRVTVRILGTSATLAIVLLQGGSHVFTWFALLTILYLAAKMFLDRRIDIRVVAIIPLVVLLTYARVYPTAQAYAGFRQPITGGYHPINFSAWGLIPPVLLPPIDAFFVERVWMGVPSWDGAIFWGAALIVAPVVGLHVWRSHQDRSVVRLHQNTYSGLAFSSAVLLALSFFSIYSATVRAADSLLPIPFISGAEKYSYRLAIPSFLGLSVVTAAHWNGVLKSLDGLWRRRAGSYALNRLVPPLSRFLGVASMVFLVGLGASVLFPQALLAPIKHMIEEAYLGSGFSWLSQYMESRGTYSLEYYFGRAEGGIPTLRAWLLMGSMLCGVPALVLRTLSCNRDRGHELAIALPLLLASASWLSLAVSVPFETLQVQTVRPPKLISNPDGAVLEIVADPKAIAIRQQQGTRATEIVLPEIRREDRQFLQILSDNAEFADSDGSLSILPQDGQLIVVGFNVPPYGRAIALMLVAWASLLAYSAISAALRHRRT